jgi:hypothetical protein
MVVSYLTKCALAAGDSLVKADQNGKNYTREGGAGPRIGLLIRFSNTHERVSST